MHEKYLDKIICGNASTTLKDITNNSIDLVITSPPYYKQRNYGKGIGNEESIDEYIENLIIIFKECINKIKDSGSIVFNIGDKYKDGSLLLAPYRFAIEITKRFKVKLINEVRWVKLNPVPKQDNKKLIPSSEPFFIFVKSKNYFFNKNAFLGFINFVRKKPKNGNNIGKKYFEIIEKSDLSQEQKHKAFLKLDEVIKEVKRREIEGFRMKIKGIHAMPYGGQAGGRKIHIERDGFTIIKIKGNAIKRDIIESPVETIKGNIHPAVFPEYIIQEFIKLLTEKGDIVLDPFMGSGTACVVAKKMKRHYIGIEINSEYCEYAKRRISSIKNNTLFEEIIF